MAKDYILPQYADISHFPRLSDIKGEMENELLSEDGPNPDIEAREDIEVPDARELSEEDRHWFLTGIGQQFGWFDSIPSTLSSMLVAATLVLILLDFIKGPEWREHNQQWNDAAVHMIVSCLSWTAAKCVEIGTRPARFTKYNWFMTKVGIYLVISYGIFVSMELIKDHGTIILSRLKGQ